MFQHHYLLHLDKTSKKQESLMPRAKEMPKGQKLGGAGNRTLLTMLVVVRLRIALDVAYLDHLYFKAAEQYC